MIKAFIFDFDGLIIDTETSCYQAWETIYHRYQIQLPLSEWIKCVGSSTAQFDPLGYLLTKTQKKLPILELEAEQYQIHYKNSLQSPILPGILTYLNFAKKVGIHLAIASSSPANWVTDQLKQKNILHYFDLIVTADDVKEVKPAPDLYLTAKQKLNINDFEGLVFEDSEHGIHAATLAKLFTIAVPNQITKYSDFSKATIVLNSLGQISPNELITLIQNQKCEN